MMLIPNIYRFFPPPNLPRRSRVDSKTLTRNTRLIAEALTRVIYNLTEKVRQPFPSRWLQALHPVHPVGRD